MFCNHARPSFTSTSTSTSRHHNTARTVYQRRSIDAWPSKALLQCHDREPQLQSPAWRLPKALHRLLTTRRLRVETCGRGAGTHGDVLNLHTEVFWTDTRGGGGRRVIVSSACQNLPTEGHHVPQRFTKETLESLPIQSLRTGRTRHVPDSFNHLLYLKAVQFQLS